MKTPGDTLVREKKIMAQAMKPTNYPDLWMHVHIVGPEKRNFPRLMSLAKCWKADDLESADIVLFTGRVTDVHPMLYGRNSHFETYVDVDQDIEMIQAFRECVSLGIPMVGICGGAQFLHVMNGGKLYQDVDGHNQSHDMWVKSEHRLIETSSVHHQMCDWQPSMEVLAECEVSSKKWADDKICYKPPLVAENSKERDIEAFFYPETLCFGTQGHPEYSGFDEYTKWFLKTIEELIIFNIDMSYGEDEKAQRLNKEIRDRRKWREPDYVEKFMKEFA